jgi:hypothetical protein
MSGFTMQVNQCRFQERASSASGNGHVASEFGASAVPNYGDGYLQSINGLAYRFVQTPFYVKQRNKEGTYHTLVDNRAILALRYLDCQRPEYMQGVLEHDYSINKEK